MIFGAPLPLRPLRRRPVLDPRRPAADRDPRGHLRRLPGARQLPPRPRLVPALDALLRRQLGDQPVAVPQGERRRGRSSTARSSRRRRSSSSSWRTFYDRELIEVLLYKGLAFRSMHSHGRALNGLLRARGRRRRGLRRARGRADRRRRPRLQLRRRPLPRPAAARGGPGALRLRAGRAAGGHARVPAGRTCSASATGSSTPPTGLVEEGWVDVADMVDAPALARRAARSRSQ